MSCAVHRATSGYQRNSGGPESAARRATSVYRRVISVRSSRCSPGGAAIGLRERCVLPKSDARQPEQRHTNTLIMADASAAMAVDEVQIDEALYSRQLYVLGHEAMRRMAGATVLIVGLKGLGVEIAKNVVLAGVKSVTLHDDAPVALSDLSAQFFLTEADVGKPRAEVTAPRLAELNQYTPVARSTEALTPALCASFGIVVLTGVPLAEAVAINEACRGAGARFIAVDTFGAFGAVFCDFGDAFTVYDTNGEEPLSAMVSSISQRRRGSSPCSTRLRASRTATSSRSPR